MRTRWLLSIAIVILALITGAPVAHAVCTNPDGAAGNIVFNKDHQVMQYCDDTNWRQLGPRPSGPTGCPNIGDTCSDGTIYAGDSPDGDVPMYTTLADAPLLLSWNNGSGGTSDTVMDNCNDGPPGTASSCQTGQANTTFLVGAASEPYYPFEAAEYCAAISAHGYNDWYLPAQDELYVLYTNKNSGDLNGTFDESGSYPTGYYWSSSEEDSINAEFRLFGFSPISPTTKVDELAVRCVRKEGTKLTSIVPDGLIGHWRLDEGDFPYKDSSPTGADATNSGGTDPVSVPAQLSDGLDFINDSSRRISTATSPAYAGLTTFTIAAWIKSDDVEGGSYNGIIDIEGIGGLYIGWNNNRLSFHADGWDTQVGSWNISDRLASGQWHHVAVTYDTTAPSGTKPTIYVDGVGDNDPKTAFTGTGSFINPASSIVTIGAFDTSGWRGFNGEIDDVRIYDRILSADEINYLYQSFDKNVKYDANHRVPKYFNGDDWVAMGESKYVPNAVEFSDAENDHLQLTGAISNLTGTKQFTYSMWFRRVIDRSISGCQTVMDMDEFGVGNRGVQFFTAGDGKLAWRAHDSAGQELLNIATSAQNFEDNRWYHIIGSFDLSNPKPATRHIYVNDVLDQSNDLATISGPDIDFSTVNRTSFGSNAATSACGVDMEFADVWFDAGTYLDLSLEANRRKFIDENGDPVFLGDDGSLPTGSSPEMFLSGDTDNWHTNKGTGGGFTENGALTDAITKPGGPFLPADGLVGYWKLDEVSGSSVIDYASANNGIYTDSDGAAANVNSQGGVHGGALDFSGHKVALGTTKDLDFSGTNAFTISAWVKPSDDGNVILKRGTGTGTNWSYVFERYHVDRSRWRLQIRTDGGIQFILSPSDEVDVGVWSHMVGTWDGSNLTIYENTSVIASNSYAGLSLEDHPTPAYQNTSIGGDGRDENYYFSGLIDDVAVYDRALSSTEVTNIYNAGICANPERLNGTIVYNADFNVMQYCDAVRSDDGWQAVGP